MIERYKSDGMAEIWSENYRYKLWLRVLWAHAVANFQFEERSVWLKEDLEGLKLVPNLEITAEKVHEHEERTEHEFVAFLDAVREVAPTRNVANKLHFGLTSSDVQDTAFAQQLLDAGSMLTNRLSDLCKVLSALGRDHKKTVMLGRTHGQFAEITTLEHVLSSHAEELSRGVNRLERAGEEIRYGCLSGPVGTNAHTSPKTEYEAMRILGLHAEPASTQVVPRDRHAIYFATLASVGGSLERLALNIRHLSRSEVDEISEFRGSRAIGSSSMPQKFNPIQSEKVCGMARLLRGYSTAALENVALWHDRDMSHSSVERVIAEDATSVLEHMIVTMTQVMSNLVVDPAKMKHNIQKFGGMVYAHTLMLALVRAGMDRRLAHNVIADCCLRAHDSMYLIDLVKQSVIVTKLLTGHQIDACFSQDSALRHVQ